MKLIISILLTVVVLVNSSPIDLLDEAWLNFKVNFNKQYDDLAEEKLRLNIYKDNLDKIARHNERYARGEVSYFLKENHLADLTHEEYVELILSKPMQSNFPKTNLLFKANSNKTIPLEQDWRKHGAVTAIKNQGQCGSCWAFSTTGSIEGQLYLKHKKLVSLSEQQLMDCSNNYGNLGCSGGLMDQAFRYIIDIGGIDTEKSYPYETQDDECRFNKKNVAAKVKSYVDIESGSEEALQEAVAKVGPVSVAIDAGQFSFQLYGGGIYNEPYCSSTMLDHGVLAVGYGTEQGGDYWLVKNSWGSSWGMSGYIKMSRNKNNQCGIATQASYPILE